MTLDARTNSFDTDQKGVPNVLTLVPNGILMILGVQILKHFRESSINVGANGDIWG